MLRGVNKNPSVHAQDQSERVAIYENYKKDKN